MAKNTGKVREFCQSGKVGTLMETKTCCLTLSFAPAYLVLIIHDVSHDVTMMFKLTQEFCVVEIDLQQ